MKADRTFLGFDYGERRIGVAVGQSVTGTASPLSTVNVRDGEPDWDSIDGIVSTWKPDGLVVGEPLHMDGRPQTMTRRARRFRHALRSRFGLPVHAADERLTTVEARAELAGRGAFRGAGAGRRHEVDHPVAARIILESWLGERRPDVAGSKAGGEAPAARPDRGPTRARTRTRERRRTRRRTRLPRRTVMAASGSMPADAAAYPVSGGGEPFHIIDPEPFHRAFLDEICALATEIRAVAKTRDGRLGLQALLGDRRAMLYFTQPSTRTFLSFNNACHILGIRTSEIRDPSTSSEVKGESLEDSIRTFSSYVDVIIMRSAEPGLAARAARMMDSIARPVPIVNAGSGPDQHPTQALLDIYTLDRSFAERGGIEGKTIGMMGDLARGRTVRSLCHLLRHYPGVRLRFLSPPAFRMRGDVKALLERHGIDLEETDSPGEVLPELDALYLTRLQSEYDGPGETARFDHARFRLGPDELRRMKPDAIIMHPLPRGPELDPRVDEDPRAMYWRQERNGMWVRVALLIRILGAAAGFREIRP